MPFVNDRFQLNVRQAFNSRVTNRRHQKSRKIACFKIKICGSKFGGPKFVKLTYSTIVVNAESKVESSLQLAGI